MAVGIGKYLRSKTCGRRYWDGQRGTEGPTYAVADAENTWSMLPTQYGRGCGGRGCGKYAVDVVFWRLTRSMQCLVRPLLVC